MHSDSFGSLCDLSVLSGEADSLVLLSHVARHLPAGVVLLDSSCDSGSPPRLDTQVFRCACSAAARHGPVAVLRSIASYRPESQMAEMREAFVLHHIP